MNRRTIGMLVLVGAMVGCSKSEAPPAPTPAPAAATTSAAPATPPPPHDPDGLPDYVAHAPTCTPAGDAAAMRTRLREIEKGREAAPPVLASLLEGCAVPPADVAKALKKAGTTFSRHRDHASAAAYYRLAIQADPSSLDARYALAGSRANLGDAAGALYQLEQIRAAGAPGARFEVRSLRDSALAALRARRAYWTFMHDPVPDVVAAIPEDATLLPDASPLAAMAFEPALAVAPDTIYERVRLEHTHFRIIGDAVHDATGVTFRGYRGLKREDVEVPIVDALTAAGLELLTAPTIYRFTDHDELLAIPFFGDLEGTIGPVSIVARKEPNGAYSVMRVLTSNSGECTQPVLFTTRDRRVMGWVSSCVEGSDLGRCMTFARDGSVVTRCSDRFAAGANDETESEDSDYVD